MRSALSPLALCALLTLAACDSAGGGGGDLRATLSATDVVITDVATAPLSFTNTVLVVATVEGTAPVTAVSFSSTYVGATLDSTRADGPSRTRAYVRLQGLSGRTTAYGPATLRLSAGAAAAEIPVTVHPGVASALEFGHVLPGVQLAHGREALASVQRSALRLADAPAGLSLREQASGATVRTFLTASATVRPNAVQRVLLHRVTPEGWAYETVTAPIVVRSATPAATARVRTRSISSGSRFTAASNGTVTAVAQSGALVTRAAPGGAPEAHLNGVRSIAPLYFRRSLLLYRDGRVARADNDLEAGGVTVLGDLDPADAAENGAMLLRDGSVWFTEDTPGFRLLYDAVRFTTLPVLPASAEASFVAIVSDRREDAQGPQMTLAASADGRLWAATATQRLAPTARRLPSAPREMVQFYGVYAARLADGSVWTWFSDVLGDPASLTAPTQIPGLVAARMVSYGNGLLALRADGSAASWGRPTSIQDPCPLFALCERPAWAGARDGVAAAYVRADGKVYNTSFLQLEFGDAQPPLVPAE